MIHRFHDSGQREKLIFEFSKEGVTIGFSGKSLSRLKIASPLESHSSLTFDSNRELMTKWIQETCQSAGIAESVSGVVCVPRSICCIHRLVVQSIALDQLPGLVALEMEAIYGDEVVDHEWDYLVSSIDSTGNDQIVVVYSLPKRYLESITELFSDVGIRLDQITLMEMGFPSNCPISDDTLTHVIALRDASVELVVCDQKVVFQSQSFPIDSAADLSIDVLVGTLRRLQASLPESLVSMTSSRLLLVDTNTYNPGGLDAKPSWPHRATFIQRAVEAGFDVSEQDLLRCLGDVSLVKHRVIDLMHPRRSAPERMSPRMMSAIAVGLCLLLFCGWWGINRYQLNQLNESLIALEAEQNQAGQAFAELAPKLAAVGQLRQWERSSVRWDQQIQSLSQPFVTSESLYIVRMQMDSPRRDGEQPLTRIEGRSTSPANVLLLTRELATKNPGSSVQPNGIEPNRVDPQFGSQFRMEIKKSDTIQTPAGMGQDEA